MRCCSCYGHASHTINHPNTPPLASPSLSNQKTMPLYTLCAASSLVITKPLSFPSKLPSTTTATSSPSLSLHLPDLPSHVKDKILSLELMGVDSGRALSLNPALRDAPLDSLHAVVSFLQSRGIHFKDLGRILGMCPSILTASVRADLRPVFAFLSDDLAVPDTAYRRVIVKCPRVLASSVRDQLRPALLYLRRLGFTDNNALAYQDPVLLVSSVEKTMIPKLEFLMGLGMTKEDAVSMVLRCPGLFTFSIDKNFKPKYVYLVQEMGGGVEDVKSFPQYFTFSLEKRIMPRHRAAAEAGVELPVPELLKSTDEEFRELLHLKKRG